MQIFREESYPSGLPRDRQRRSSLMCSPRDREKEILHFFPFNVEYNEEKKITSVLIKRLFTTSHGRMHCGRNSSILSRIESLGGESPSPGHRALLRSSEDGMVAGSAFALEFLLNNR
jgi:hypothetical protein